MPGAGQPGLARRAAGRAASGCLFTWVFTLPAEVAAIAFQNKAVVYTILFKAAAEDLLQRFDYWR